MTSEKLRLRWNVLKSNVSPAFKQLREEEDFFDVTLVHDDEQIRAHKAILSAGSPPFRNVLRRNSPQHPSLYLKDLKYTHHQPVLNHGEGNQKQQLLPRCYYHHPKPK